MKKNALHLINLCLALSLLLSACIAQKFVCKDSLGCVTIANKAPIKVAALLTLSGPDSPYGVDALRGVEIAIAEKQELFGHPIELVKVDDQCSADGGEKGAEQIAADPQIVGVIGATCSSASVAAAKILTDAKKVLISPSSTAPSLTDASEHQAGFFRTIYNDKAQGKAVANFAYTVLGARSMTTFNDGTAYSQELQAAACENFVQLGGTCLGTVQIKSGEDLTAKMDWIAKLHTDVLYYPVYTEEGVAITESIAKAGITSALIASDGLLSKDFAQKAAATSEGMYISGPAQVNESQDFIAKYKAAYGEDPIAAYHLQAYDAALTLFTAIEEAAVPASSNDDSTFIQLQALRDSIYNVRNANGLSGPITCSNTGDCATPNIEIFQIQDGNFVPIYP